jgi:hypothetical protein
VHAQVLDDRRLRQDVRPLEVPERVLGQALALARSCRVELGLDVRANP